MDFSSLIVQINELEEFNHIKRAQYNEELSSYSQTKIKLERGMSNRVHVNLFFRAK